MNNNIEKDIKILENMTKQDFSNPMGWSGYYDSELKELQQSIENILADRERLIEMLKNSDTENIELQKEIEELKNDTYWKRIYSKAK